MFPIACFLLLAGFLGCLGLFALAVTKVVTPDGQGHARGFLGGCAAVLALFLLCGLGLTGLAATVAAIGVGSVRSWNPIRHIEVRREHPAPRSSRAPGEREHGESAVAARFTVRGDAGRELVELLGDVVDLDPETLGEGLTVHRQVDPRGGEFAVYEFRLPISEAELEHFERDLRTELDGLELRLPERVDIEFQGAE